jgi:hypothetical protein
VNDNPENVDEAMVCDVCRSPVGDIDRAMLFWDFEPAPVARVSHKRCERRAARNDTGDELGLSAELYWFADREAALWQLARIVGCYDELTVKQLRKMVYVAWATPFVATKQQREKALRIVRMGLSF